MTTNERTRTIRRVAGLSAIFIMSALAAGCGDSATADWVNVDPATLQKENQAFEQGERDRALADAKTLFPPLGMAVESPMYYTNCFILQRERDKALFKGCIQNHRIETLQTLEPRPAVG